MKEILLTQGKIAFVDDADYDYVTQWKWQARRDLHTFYAVRTVGQKPNQKSVRMHSILLNVPCGFQSDHIDGDGLNNTRLNLRVCTHSQNQANSKSWLATTSKYKGVSWHRKMGKWMAKIKHNGKDFHLGYFDDEVDAARAYNKVAIKYFGDFARLNEIAKERV